MNLSPKFRPQTGPANRTNPAHRTAPLQAPLKSAHRFSLVPTITNCTDNKDKLRKAHSLPQAWLPSARNLPRGTRPPSVLRRQGVVTRSSSAFIQDSADVIPDAYEDEDDDEDTPRTPPSAQQVVVVGAGVTGIMSAIYMARRGYQVTVHEQLPTRAEVDAAVAAGRLSPVVSKQVVLSNRALLAFKELKVNLPFRREDGSFVPLIGIIDVMTNKMEDWGANLPFSQAAVYEYQELRHQLMDEAKRLYPSNIKFCWGSQLDSVNFDKEKATFRQYGEPKGASVSVAGDRVKPRMGCSMFAQATRPVAQAEVNATAKIPEWDTAARALSAAEARSAGAEGKSEQELDVDFDLLIGADGVDSRVRACMLKAKVYDFNQQECMRDAESFVYVSDLPLPPTEATAMSELESAVPGISSHKPRQYLYRFEDRAAPTLELWMPEPGTIAGTVSGVLSALDVATISELLQKAYGSRLPTSWLRLIEEQVRRASSNGGIHPCGRTVQCSKFDAPGTVLVGDAAHAMTGSLRQGLSCAIESVRLLNVIMKVSGGRMNRAPMIFSEVRREDVHCMQTLEQMQRSQKPNAVSGDFIFAIFGWISSMAWHSASLASSILSKLMPSNFSLTWMTEQLRDGRQGYHEVLKVFTRFAALPVLCMVLAVGFGLRSNITDMLGWA